MIGKKEGLFRTEALERSSSPERLDEILQIVSPKNWIPLTALGVLVATGLAWSIVGRIPIAVSGQGVLVYPSRVKDFQSPNAGQLTALHVQVGDFVKKGDVLATIDQTELQKQLQQQRNKLASLQLQNQNVNSLQGQRSSLEISALEQQRRNLEQKIAEAESLSPILRSRGIDALVQQRQNLQQRLKESYALAPTFEDRLARRKALRAEGAISEDTVLEAQQTSLDNIKKVADLQDQLKELEVRQIEAEKSYRQNLSQIADARTQLKDLDTKEKSLTEQNVTASVNRQNQIQDVQRTISQMEVQLKNNSRIISQYSGRILEIMATPGQILTPGTRLGLIEAQEVAGKLVGVTFLPTAEGKKIQKGMTVQITPSTVKREQFGGIVGTVSAVSPFPVTKEGATRLVGSAETVQSLMAQGPQIEVFVDLQPDSSTFSGYRWSSSAGPRQKMTSGTTTSARVTVEESAPITFVFPILKSWTGIY